MSDVKKLAKLLQELDIYSESTSFETQAQFLIANGLSFCDVVHCRDCKYYKPQNGSVRWNHKTPYCMRKTVMKVSPDDFCSFGEREVK